MSIAVRNIYLSSNIPFQVRQAPIGQIGQSQRFRILRVSNGDLEEKTFADRHLTQIGTIPKIPTPEECGQIKCVDGRELAVNFPALISNTRYLQPDCDVLFIVPKDRPDAADLVTHNLSPSDRSKFLQKSASSLLKTACGLQFPQLDTPQIRRALFIVDVILENNPGDIHALVLKGKILRVAGHLDRAIVIHQIAYRVDRDPRSRIMTINELVRSLSANNQVGEALKIIAMEVPNYPGDAKLRTFFAKILFASGQRDLALKQFEESQRLQPFDSVNILAWVKALERMNRTQEARRVLAAAIINNPHDLDLRMAWNQI